MVKINKSLLLLSFTILFIVTHLLRLLVWRLCTLWCFRFVGSSGFGFCSITLVIHLLIRLLFFSTLLFGSFLHLLLWLIAFIAVCFDFLALRFLCCWFRLLLLVWVTIGLFIFLSSFALSSGLLNWFSLNFWLCFSNLLLGFFLFLWLLIFVLTSLFLLGLLLRCCYLLLLGLGFLSCGHLLSIFLYILHTWLLFLFIIASSAFFSFLRSSDFLCGFLLLWFLFTVLLFLGQRFFGNLFLLWLLLFLHFTVTGGGGTLIFISSFYCLLSLVSGLSGWGASGSGCFLLLWGVRCGWFLGLALRIFLLGFGLLCWLTDFFLGDGLGWNCFLLGDYFSHLSLFFLRVNNSSSRSLSVWIFKVINQASNVCTICVSI